MSSRSMIFSLCLLSVLARPLMAATNPISIDCLLRGSCVSGQDVLEHLKSLQSIADANNGNRSAGSTGHEFSANYVAQKLLAAGYKVELRPFQFMKFNMLSASVALIAPQESNYENEKDFNVMSYSGSGSVSAQITAVDLALGAGNNSSSGCEAEDFKDFPAGNIALIQRGTCAFQQKVENAQAAKASAVVLFNQGNSSDREELFIGTLSEGSSVTIPVVSISYKLGIELNDLGTAMLSMDIETKVDKKISHNVVAETKTGNPDNVVMVGAHLDSVPEGPGINDNGSGSSAILEVALKMKNVTTNNKVRFAWFSAEELGLIGSTKYVEGLTEVEKSKIALYINVDMVGSPNYKISVFDGDGSRYGQKGPEGSAAIEKLLHGFYNTHGVQSVETELDGRSDYAAFSAAGIAVGGIFTGAEGKKTEEEAAAFGGKVGEAYDACYHKACDDINNINVTALELNTNAIAFTLLSFGDSTASIRKLNKMSSPLLLRNKVAFPKHHRCNGDVHHE